MSHVAGVHLRSTIQIRDLAALFQAVPSGSTIDVYREVAIDQNALGRRGAFMRKEILKRLNAAYRIAPGDPEFEAFRWLWSLNDLAKPMLALQRVHENDFLLRAACRLVTGSEFGCTIDMGELVRAVKPGLSPLTSKRAASHLAGSLRQAGVIAGKPALRVAPVVEVENVTYAALTAYNRGKRGQALLTSEEFSILGLDNAKLVVLLRAAHTRGWLDFQESGTVVSVEPKGPLLDARP